MIKVIKIVDKRGSGKTTKLIELAVKNHGILVVPNIRMVHAAEDLAKRMGVLDDFDCITFYAFTHYYDVGKYTNSERKFYIDELYACLSTVGVLAYSNSIEEENQNGSI